MYSPDQKRVTATEVNGSVENIVQAFIAWLEAKGIIIYATVNHAKDMRDRGIEPAVEAWTVIFGNPALGAGMLAIDPEIVVDIPLRVGFYGRDEGTTVVVRRLMHGSMSDYDQTDLMAPANTADTLVNSWIDSLS